MVANAPYSVQATLRRRFGRTPAALPTTLVRRLARIGAISARGSVKVLVERLPGVSDSVSDLDVVERNVSGLAVLKGVPMKIGQVLGYMDMRLPEQTRSAYAVLFDCAPSIPLGHVKATIGRSLPVRGRQLMANMEPRPLAVASIGQVHRTWVDGVPLAVKVKHPAIEKAIENDFKPAELGARISAWLANTINRETLVREIEERVRTECNYEREARQQTKFGERFADHPDLRIPAVRPEFCGSGVITSELVEGATLSRFLARRPSQAERDRAGAALFDFYFGALFRFGIYNCDPHPGNYFFCDDGRVAVVDHGCTHRFPAAFVGRVARLTRAVQADDRDAMRDALHGLDMLGSVHSFDAETARAALRWFYGPLLRSEPCSFEPRDAEVRDVRHNRSLSRWRMPAEFVFLTRMRVGLAAVLARLGARVDWSERLAGALEVCEVQLARERPFDDGDSRVDVVLVEPGGRVIELVRALRERYDISIAQAKVLVDRAPSVVQSGANSADAEIARGHLESLGCSVELRRRDA